MRIKSFEVSGLARTDGASISRNLNDDLNIITGRNGSGKTTLLKLLWYIISGNIEHAISEVPFSKATVETDRYKITLSKRGSSLDEVDIILNGERMHFEDVYDDDHEIFLVASQEANGVVKDIGSSVFFPTFRRIEGGFSLASGAKRGGLGSPRITRNQSALEDAMIDLSRRMTVSNHVFVSSISTVDIVGLLMRQYTEMSELSNNIQQETSSKIIQNIKDYKQEIDPNASAESAVGVLDGIKSMIEDLDRRRESVLAPLNAVRSLAEKLFKHTGIVLNSRISFGDAANAVSSEVLSAGEKQMLSFICYNAFYKDSVIFIDEPELSLHVDWQRQLFPILQGQGTSNQFIIATHSPFIYSKYPDKEIILNNDRGEEDVSWGASS